MTMPEVPEPATLFDTVEFNSVPPLFTKAAPASPEDVLPSSVLFSMRTEPRVCRPPPLMVPLKAPTLPLSDTELFAIVLKKPLPA